MVRGGGRLPDPERLPGDHGRPVLARMHVWRLEWPDATHPRRPGNRRAAPFVPVAATSPSARPWPVRSCCPRPSCRRPWAGAPRPVARNFSFRQKASRLSRLAGAAARRHHTRRRLRTFRQHADTTERNKIGSPTTVGAEHTESAGWNRIEQCKTVKKRNQIRGSRTINYLLFPFFYRHLP